MPRFDFHVHSYPEFLAGKARDTMAFKENIQSDGTPAGQMEYMRGHDFRHCTLLNIAATPHSMHKVNLFAVETARKTGQLVFGSVHPEAEDVLEELDWLCEQGIRGIKFHTGYQNFDFGDSRYAPVYRRIGELGMASCIHCGKFFRSPKYLVYPGDVAKVIGFFDGAPFICAHMGGVEPEHPEFPVLKELPVYVDTALTPYRMKPEQFARAAEELGRQRILFGTDMPWEDPEKLIVWLRNALSDPDGSIMEDILWNNAMALCRKVAPELVSRWETEE